MEGLVGLSVVSQPWTSAGWAVAMEAPGSQEPSRLGPVLRPQLNTGMAGWWWGAGVGGLGLGHSSEGAPPPAHLLSP